MSDNLLWPSQGPATTQQFIKTTETSGVHVQHVIVDSAPEVTINTSGLATEGKQDAGIAVLADILSALSVLPSGGATLAEQEAQTALLTTIDADTSALAGVDFATGADIASVVSALTGMATEAKQDTIIGHLDGVEGLLSTIDADTSNLALVDFATQTTLAAVLAKIIAAPATEAKQDTQITHQSNAATSLAIVDDWDESDRAKVNLIVGQAGVAGGSGVVSALTQRVVLATNVALPAGSNVIGKVGHDVTGVGHGVKTVTTAGTDVVLASSTPCKWVKIQAQTDNTNVIAVGASGVDAAVATGNGIILYPGDWVEILTDNLADIYIDSLADGEGVRYIYGT